MASIGSLRCAALHGIGIVKHSIFGRAVVLSGTALWTRGETAHVAMKALGIFVGRSSRKFVAGRCSFRRIIYITIRVDETVYRNEALTSQFFYSHAENRAAVSG